MLTNISDGLRRMRPTVLAGGRVASFLRIWIFAQSKSDALPEVDAPRFGDLVIEKASYEIGGLEETLRGYVTTPELLSIGEDYVLLSAAKFEPGKIDLTEHVGVDLMLPLAAVLPLERFVRWAEKLKRGQQSSFISPPIAIPSSARSSVGGRLPARPSPRTAARQARSSPGQ